MAACLWGFGKELCRGAQPAVLAGCRSGLDPAEICPRGRSCAVSVRRKKGETILCRAPRGWHRNFQGGCNELQVVKLSFLEAAYDGNPNKPGTGTISRGHLASQGDLVEACGPCRQLAWTWNSCAQLPVRHSPVLHTAGAGPVQRAGGEWSCVGAEHPDLAPGVPLQVLPWYVASPVVRQRKVESWSAGPLGWRWVEPQRGLHRLPEHVPGGGTAACSSSESQGPLAPSALVRCVLGKGRLDETGGVGSSVSERGCLCLGPRLGCVRSPASWALGSGGVR